MEFTYQTPYLRAYKKAGGFYIRCNRKTFQVSKEKFNIVKHLILEHVNTIETYLKNEPYELPKRQRRKRD